MGRSDAEFVAVAGGVGYAGRYSGIKFSLDSFAGDFLNISLNIFF